MPNSLGKLGDLPERAEKMRTITWSHQKSHNEEVCGDKGGELQMGDRNSKKEKLSVHLGTLEEGTTKVEQRGRGEERCYQEACCGHGKNCPTVNRHRD